jgi:flagella basal body P-ring formation protein FlgA
MRALAVLAALAVLIAGPALAQPVTLKADTADSDGRITLGDLFDGAGSAEAVVIAGRQGSTTVLDAGAVQMAARRAGLEWDNPQGLRRIVVRAGSSASAAAPVASRGNVDVLTYARSISVGEVVQPQDLVWTKLAAQPSNAPSDPDAVIGMAAKRPLREGAPVSFSDVAAPIVIKQGDLIDVTWSNDGITLTLQAKAMGPAGVGQPFSVMNTASNKVIQAVASGPGAAVVGPEAQQLRSARNPAQFASR